MTQPEKHTIVRFNLRSMLAITFGAAIVLTLVSPSIRALDPQKQQDLLRTLAAVACGMSLAAGWQIRKRYQLGKQCGPLLMAIPLQRKRNGKWLKWFWLLMLLPFFFAYIGFLFVQQTASGRMLNMLSIGLMAAAYSNWIARLGLELWAEGYSDGLEFCENGILFADTFHGWSSESLRDLYWGQNSENLVINIARTITTIPVPAQQREGVDAILNSYYKQQSTATDQT